MKRLLFTLLWATTATLSAQNTTPADTLTTTPANSLAPTDSLAPADSLPPTEELGTAEVTTARPLVRYEGSKAIYNLNALPGIEGANALDALNRLPNLRFREDKGLLLNGMKEVTVLIDRRPMRLSTAELEAYLSGMRAGDVARVELLQNPGPQYGTNGAPLINILTKRHLDDGYNAYITGRLSHQYYLREWASARLNVNKGISRSYINYSFNDFRSRETTELLGRNTIHADVRPQQRHQVNLGTWLQLSDTHTLDANLYGTYQNEHFYQTFGTHLTRPRLLASLQHAYRGDKVEVYTNVEGALASLKQNSLDPAYDNSLRDRSAFVRVAPSLYYTLSPSTTLNGAVAYEYTTYRNRFYTTGATFDYNEGRTMASLGLSHTGKVWSVEANATLYGYHTHAQGATAEHKDNSLVFLPNLTVHYDVAHHHRLTAEVSTTYERPDFRDITPITTQTADTWQRSGNIGLRPAHTHEYALRYTFMRAAQLEMSYSDTKRPIVEYPIEPTFGHIHLTKTNLYHSRYWRTVMVLPVPLAQGDNFTWFATTTAAIHRQWDKGVVENQGYSKAFTTYYLNHSHDLTCGTWTLSLAATYYGHLYYNLYAMRPMWWTEVSVAKRIGSWRISAYLRDPFKTNTARGRYDALAVPFEFVRQFHNPRLSLTVSYTLGNHQLKSYKDRNLYDGTSRMRSEANEGVARGVEK